MHLKFKSVNISYSHVNFKGNLVGREIVLPLGILGVVVKSPSLGGGDTPMAIFPCLVAEMTLGWFRRHKQT